jgi:putative ABC transport system permease protein
LRPEVQIVEGRQFTPALHELIIGRNAMARLDGIAVGSDIFLPEGDWRVVGVFESGGDSHESELMTDADTLLSAFDRGDGFNSVTVELEDEGAYQQFADGLSTNPALTVAVRRERDYFAETSRPISRLLTVIAYFIGGIMALGAVFAALNTMYATISARTIEIATLRAIGFGAVPVVVSVLVEALLLALLGAGLGAWLAYVLFEGDSVSNGGGDRSPGDDP